MGPRATFYKCVRRRRPSVDASEVTNRVTRSAPAGLRSRGWRGQESSPQRGGPLDAVGQRHRRNRSVFDPLKRVRFERFVIDVQIGQVFTDARDFPESTVILCSAVILCSTSCAALSSRAALPPRAFTKKVLSRADRAFMEHSLAAVSLKLRVVGANGSVRRLDGSLSFHVWRKRQEQTLSGRQRKSKRLAGLRSLGRMAQTLSCPWG